MTHRSGCRSHTRYHRPVADVDAKIRALADETGFDGYRERLVGDARVL